MGPAGRPGTARGRENLSVTFHKYCAVTEGFGEAAAGGGRSEVKRSRAGSPHGEPRTESPSEAAQPKRESRRHSGFRDRIGFVAVIMMGST